MSLTHEHLKLLSAPFKAHDHEFKPPRGYIYIAETAICERIESIDPSWEWHIHSTGRYDPKGMQATTIGHLTILGITRGGDGQQAVEFQKGSDAESGEAEKGSETDALKRAARKFGIGRYLLDCPKEVKGYGPELNKWLSSLSNIKAPMVTVSQEADAAQSAPTAHWSQDEERMSALYAKALDTCNMHVGNVQAAIAASGKPITHYTPAEAWAIVTKAANQIIQGTK